MVVSSAPISPKMSSMNTQPAASSTRPSIPLSMNAWVAMRRTLRLLPWPSRRAITELAPTPMPIATAATTNPTGCV